LSIKLKESENEAGTMGDRLEHDEDWYHDPDPWPHEPPPELLEALDRAAWRLSELDARGVTISLGIGSDGGALARLSQDGLTREIEPSSLLRLVCESPVEA
jgi:hypothetical protein